ncbi:MAG: hypothetical protein KDC53_22735 [Saprospiraceae bacterium]|nr:hypothetical protein [Saprospiraceae bacterium]
MSIFKKIKSAFVIEDEQSPSSTPDHSGGDESSPKDSQPVPTVEESSPVITSDSEEGKINQKFTEILLRALEANNQEGFDYIEFKRSIQNLFKMNMAEDTVYKSAFATAQTLGATPKGLIASAERYLTVLQKEEDKFAVALNNQKTKQIDGGMEAIKNLEQSIGAKRTQIEKLQQEISQYQEKLTEMKSEIESSAQKIASTKSDFVASYTNLVNQIRTDIENIGKYLN